MLYVLLSLLWFLAMACEIACFFLVLRLVRKGFPFTPQWVMAFDAAGSGIVDGLLSVFDRFVRPKNARVREELKILACMLGLLLARAALGVPLS